MTSALTVAIAGLLFLSFACASKPQTAEERLVERLEDLAERIDDSVDDPELAAHLKAVVDRVELEFGRGVEEVRAKRVQLAEAARKYETTDAQLETMLAELRSDAHGLAAIVRDAHFELRELVSAELWNELAEDDDKVLGIF